MVRQESKLEHRIRRLLEKAYPDFDFTRYGIQYLHYTQREHGNRPAWDFIGKRRSDGQLITFYCSETATEAARYGIQEVCGNEHSLMLTVKE